jgi:hypothetical protein
LFLRYACAAIGEFIAGFAESDFIVCDGARVRSLRASVFALQRKSHLNEAIFFTGTCMARYVVVHSRDGLRGFGCMPGCAAMDARLMKS